MHLKPYHFRLLYALLEDDPDRILQFWVIVDSQLTEQPDLLSKIVRIAQECIRLSSHVNRYNSVYWDDENLQVIMTTQLN
ncbi:hypothetical protein TNCT_86941 [Trichonephila clavata]|uniref:Uncharacterized protein n=1 Tax=Trichonephila clavata TaxID=2740835 RepID=A0A8X6J7R7_TRICU|nr:hypothetical protein TNCT_86941 [Trichonephila clavata]